MSKVREIQERWVLTLQRRRIWVVQQPICLQHVFADGGNNVEISGLVLLSTFSRGLVLNSFAVLVLAILSPTP